jgi:creatinine amidohydrolase
MLATRYWAEMSWIDFSAADMARTITVLPVAAIEQHGPHLPVGVDTMIAQGYLDRVIPALPAELSALFLPIQTVGKSNEHFHFPGTLTLGYETAIRAWIEIGESVARAGGRKLVIVNSHGGNTAMIEIIARELRVRHSMLAVTASWSRLGFPPELFSAEEMRLGIHGGEMETSLMLAFRPELVRMERAHDFRSVQEAMERDHAHLRATQPVGFGWMSQDLNPTGVVGNASIATREKGEQAADYGAARFIELLQDVQRFDMAQLSNVPLA